MKAMDISKQRKKDEGNKVQARVEVVEEESSSVADHFGKISLKGNDIMRTV